MKIRCLILVAVVAGITTVNQGAVVFPSASGLVVYDSSTDTSQFIPTTSGISYFAGSVGNYSVVITTGQTVNGGPDPILSLNVAATRNAGGTSLLIFYSDIGFGPSFGTYSLSTFLASGPLSSFAFLSPLNTPFGQDVSLGGSADAQASVTVNASGPINAGAPFSLTIEDIVTGNVVSANTELTVVPVPEPGEIALMSLGGVFMCIILLRRKLAA